MSWAHYKPDTAMAVGWLGVNLPLQISSQTEMMAAEIQWMNGERQSLGPTAANQALIITEGSESPVRVY